MLKMAVLSQLSPALRECIAIHEALRRLGFSAESLFLFSAINGVGIQLRNEHGEFNVLAGTDPFENLEALQAAWLEANEAWIGDTADERERLWQESHVCNQSVELITALMARGFYARELTEAKR